MPKIMVFDAERYERKDQNKQPTGEFVVKLRYANIDEAPARTDNHLGGYTPVEHNCPDSIWAALVNAPQFPGVFHVTNYKTVEIWVGQKDARQRIPIPVPSELKLAGELIIK